RVGAGDPSNAQAMDPILHIYNEQAAKLLEEDALKVQLPSGDFGVQGNGLGYDEWGNLYVHLAQVLNDKTKQPLQDFAGVKVEMVPLTVGSKTHYLPVVEGASFGPGAAGATLKATLWLGTPAGGFRKQQEVQTQTDAKGNAIF